MNNDIPITVTASDRATAILDEVSASVNRLVSDTNSFQAASEAAAQKVELSFGAVGTAAAALGAAYLAVKAATAGFAATMQLTGEYDAEQQAMRGLTDQQKQFTESIEASLGVQDQAVAKIMKRAAVLGVEDSALENVTKATIGVAESLGIDYDAALRKVLGSEGDLANVQKAAEAGLRQKKDAMGTATGAGKALTNQLQNLRETIGGILAPLTELTQRSLASLVSVINTAVTPAINIMRAAFEVIAPIFAQMAQALGSVGASLAESVKSVAMAIATGYVAAATIAETVFDNMAEVIILACDTIELAVIQWTEILKHSFTQVLPAYVTWFAENFFNIMRDMAVGVMTIIENLGKNLGEAVFAIFNWIRGGMQGGMEGLMQDLGKGLYVNLLEGFEAQTSALPDVMKRQITAREGELADSIAKQATDLATEFNTKFDDRMGQMKSRLDAGFAVGVDLSALDGVNAKTKNTLAELKAAGSRLETRGRADDPAAQQLDVLKQNNRALNQIADNTKPANKPADGIKVEVVGVS